MAELEKLLCTDSKVESLKKINAIIENGTGHGGFNLFDTKLLDRVLSYKESKGWALQGTYVYKEAVAGSRYGYPDFYAKCTDEKDLGTPTETTLGENTITLYTNANGHTFYDIADKEAIDAWYDTYGIAWYYGIDTENERVFLPRTKWFIQPTGEVTEVNSVNESGLPNITGTLMAYGYKNGNTSGAFKSTVQSASQLTLGAGEGAFIHFTLDASRSSSIYGNSDTVQPPSINQLLYICVGNTNVESAVTDVVDVTTTENDTVPLFTGMYFDFTPNNVSWLKAGQQANNEGIYRTCYNELVNILNGETKYGDLKVINVADMEAGVDYSLYWKVNQEDMTFITPTAISNKALSGGVMGNGMTLGLTNGLENSGLFSGVISGNSVIGGSQNSYGLPIGTNKTLSLTGNDLSLGVTTDPTKSGIIAEQATSQLYFKVANAVQNLELLDAGEVLEVLSTKTDKLQACEASFPSNKYIDLTLGASGTTYTAPANGWYLCSKKSAASNQDLFVTVNDVSRAYQDVTSTGRALTVFTPVNKGDVLKITYSASGNTSYFRFYYCNGEV